MQEQCDDVILRMLTAQIVGMFVVFALILYALGTTLLLGSWYGLLFGLILLVAVARRAVMEERTLQAELRGYGAYMAKVKYRLIPYVW